MKIYTKGGDKGFTSTYSGARRPKSDLLFHIIGNIDNLGVLVADALRQLENSENVIDRNIVYYCTPYQPNVFLERLTYNFEALKNEKSYFDILINKFCLTSDTVLIHLCLAEIQQRLFKINSIIATTKSDAKFKPKKELVLESTEVERLELFIDYMAYIIPPLKTFILPNSTSEFPITLHKARTQTRLTERILTEYNNTAEEVDKIPESVQKYVNRLSDLFFKLARFYNYLYKIKEYPVNIE